MLKLKRIYDPPSPRDGIRILVDRVWPRGMSKERARIAQWQKDVAPSTSLRKWFGHDPARWKRFRQRYRIELTESTPAHALNVLAQLAKHRRVTLVYSASDEAHNQAVVLKEILDKLAGSAKP
jgi:uncharacterized protein YeaO (DUF488 family)